MLWLPFAWLTCDWLLILPRWNDWTAFKKHGNFNGAVVNALPNLSISWRALVSWVLKLMNKTHRSHRQQEAAPRCIFGLREQQPRQVVSLISLLCLQQLWLRKNLRKMLYLAKEYNINYREKGKFWWRGCVIGNHLGWGPTKFWLLAWGLCLNGQK